MQKKRIAVALVAVMAWGGAAQAEFIPLDNLLEFPDLASAFLQVDYVAGTNVLMANGVAVEYDDGGGPEQINNGLFEITAEINDFGDAVGGTLSIEGDLVSLGYPAVSLLAGNLLDFGFNDNGGQILEFLFEVTDGDLAPDYGGIGALIGVILDVEATYSGDFTMSFSNGGQGFSNTRPVPTPSSLALLLAASAVATRGRRTR